VRLNVRRKERFEAIMIQTPEDEQAVRQWIAATGIRNVENFPLEELIRKRDVFLYSSASVLSVVPERKYYEEFEVSIE
jgi:hypothetical protein